MVILVVLLVVMVLGAKEMTEAGLSQEEETERIELLEGQKGVRRVAGGKAGA